MARFKASSSSLTLDLDLDTFIKKLSGPAAATRRDNTPELELLLLVAVINIDGHNDGKERGAELRLLQQQQQHRQQLPSPELLFPAAAPPLRPRCLLQGRGLPRRGRRRPEGLQADDPWHARPRHHLAQGPLEGPAAQAARRGRRPARRQERDRAGDGAAPRRRAQVGASRGRLLEGACSFEWQQ